MTSQAAGASRTQDGKAHVSLGRTGRMAFYALACLGLLSGGTAVFLSTNQAGTVALIAIGAISLVIAIAGRMPLKWALGAGTFDLSDAAAAEAGAAVVAENLPPPAMHDLVQAMNRAAQGRPVAMSQALERYSNFESQAAERVSAVTRAHGWTYLSERTPDRGVDAIVRADNGKEACIEYKLTSTRNNRRNRMMDLLARAAIVTPLPLIAVLSEGNDAEFPYIDAFRKQGADLLFLDDPEFENSLALALSRVLDS